MDFAFVNLKNLKTAKVIALKSLQLYSIDYAKLLEGIIRLYQGNKGPHQVLSHA